MANVTGWGRSTWGSSTWGEPVPVDVTGVAGTGSVGLEALSRGASRVTFVEKSPQALSILEKNLALFPERG